MSNKIRCTQCFIKIRELPEADFIVNGESVCSMHFSFIRQALQDHEKAVREEIVMEFEDGRCDRCGGKGLTKLES